jgi:hypothetical protein
MGNLYMKRLMRQRRAKVIQGLLTKAPSRARRQTGGRLRQEISQAAVIEVEVMLDRAA